MSPRFRRLPQPPGWPGQAEYSTGKAIVYLMHSLAKLEETSASEAMEISFL